MNGDDLGWNKIFGAILGTALVIMVLMVGAQMIYAPHPPAKMGDLIAVAAEAGEGPAVADTPPDWGTVLPTADVAAGQAQSNKCASCHTFTPGGANGQGPNNYGVVGRTPGTAPGFVYSSAMMDFAKKTPKWDYDHLYMFLANPQGYIANTKMTFVGIKAPQDRINLIAWLRQQSASPVPIPAPNPKAAAPAAAAPAGGNATDAAKAPATGSAANATGDKGQTGTGAAAAPSTDKTAPGAPPK
jgi:cytochrome c